jgi:hypothetical protein
MFGSVSEHFVNPRHVYDEKLMFRAWMHYFEGTKIVKYPFYSTGLKMVFVSISHDFTNLQHVKRCQTCVSGLNAIFRGVPKLWSIHSSPLDPKWCLGMFRSISLTLGTSKMKTHVSGLNAIFRGYQSCEASILLHWTQNDVWECFGAFR